MKLMSLRDSNSRYGNLKLYETKQFLHDYCDIGVIFLEQSPDFPPFSSSVLQAITKTTWRTLEEIGGKSSCPRTDHYTTEPRRTRINQQKKTNIHFDYYIFKGHFQIKSHFKDNVTLVLLTILLHFETGLK